MCTVEKENFLERERVYVQFSVRSSKVLTNHDWQRLFVIIEKLVNVGLALTYNLLFAAAVLPACKRHSGVVDPL